MMSLQKKISIFLIFVICAALLIYCYKEAIIERYYSMKIFDGYVTQKLDKVKLHLYDNYLDFSTSADWCWADGFFSFLIDEGSFLELVKEQQFCATDEQWSKSFFDIRDNDIEQETKLWWNLPKIKPIYCYKRQWLKNLDYGGLVLMYWYEGGKVYGRIVLGEKP